jgi:isoamylase
VSDSLEEGSSTPLGATPSPNGVNFSLFSRNATGVQLLLFDRADDAKAARVLRLDPSVNRTYHYWHIFVPDVQPGQLYGYQVDGPSDPSIGMRFDPAKVLLDPYGRGVMVPGTYSRASACRPGDNTATAMKSVVVDVSAYDWEGDAPLRRPCSRTIIYEMHVRGFTRHPSSGVSEETRGTYAGLIEKIPYLQQLGITAVELLPVFQFDVQDAPPGQVNYWGYAPVSSFAPHQAYSSRRDPLGPVNEFRDMVKAFHRAGIEVILDVVFNHTAEGDHRGPTLSFRGLDNTTYYILEEDRSRYANYSGTGNTLNANNAIVRRMIVDSLRYWVEAMHVDGFRFDLASILARDESGNVMPSPPVLWDIESDPALAGVKLIAEAWDAAGLYQVGSFIGDSWREWNGRFRDDARSFFRGEEGAIEGFADRLIGSPSLYAHKPCAKGGRKTYLHRRSTPARSFADTHTLACRSNPSRCACRGPRDVKVAVSRASPSRRTRAPAREPSAIRPCTEAPTIPASTGDSSASRSAGPVASSAGSRLRRTSSRCTRWRIVASAAATSASVGAGAG